MFVQCVIVMAICGGFVSIASAQDFHVGVIGGLNLANLNEDPDVGIDYSTKLGLAFGGVVDLNFTETVGVRLEPMFLQKGSKAEESGIEVEFKLSYLELPVLVKASFGSESIIPYAVMGPTIGYNLSAEGEALGISIDIEEIITDFDFGITAGGGALINDMIFVEVRYALGLANIVDDPDDDDYEVTTRGIQLLGGIMF